MALHDFDEQRQYGYPVCATCGLSRTAHDEEQRIAAARREGVIEGLRLAVEAVATDDPKDAWAELSIRAELERLKAEG